MNMNPWYLERMIQDERDRVERDIEQIHLEEEAMRANCLEEKRTKAPIYRPGLLMWIVPSFIRWKFCLDR